MIVMIFMMIEIGNPHFTEPIVYQTRSSWNPQITDPTLQKRAFQNAQSTEPHFTEAHITEAHITEPHITDRTLRKRTLRKCNKLCSST